MERVLNGRYRLRQKIGDGGMAVVYQGHDLLLNREVAIKILRNQYAADPAFVARFEREAQAVAALTHPNIINIFDVGVDDHDHYFVMELIDGPNLKQMVRSRGPLPIDEAVSIVARALDGLEYAHGRGLVHRDVKPQNILLPASGQTKVSDFGIAKGLSDASLTEAGVAMGTVHYISPEQARGEPATPTSDLYAAGVVLYELLTGAVPFTADSTVGVAVKHLHDQPAPPDRVNPAVPGPLSALTLYALHKAPEARFQSAREMAAALRGWQAWTPPGAQRSAAVVPRRSAIVAPPARPRARLEAVAVPLAGSRTPRRHEGVGYLTWVVGLAVLLGLVGLLIVGFRLSPFGAVLTTPTPGMVAVVGQATAEPSPTLAAPTVVPLPVVSPTALPTARPTSTPLVPSVTPTTPPPATVTAIAVIAPSPTVALVTVPDFTGMTLAGARAAGSRVGLTVEQVEARSSSSVPSGQVIEQSVEPGSRVAPGQTIGLVISRGPARVDVPNLIGATYDAAASRLRNLGLVVERSAATSRTVAAGVVIDQLPAPGATAAVGSTVTLVVSSGDLIVVPNVVGFSRDQAVATLQGAGFVVDSVNGQTRAEILAENPSYFQVNPNVRDGQVISQTLAAGELRPRGSSIGIAYYSAR